MLFTANIHEGTATFPPAARKRLTSAGRRVGDFESQRIVTVINTYTDEQINHNIVRSKRHGNSLDKRIDNNKFIAEVDKQVKDNDFMNPTTTTASDTWGRITSKYCTTAANMAKYAAYHGLVIATPAFANPLRMTEAAMIDWFTVSMKWFRKVHKLTNGYILPHIMWDTLARGGASMAHTHFQISVVKDQYFQHYEQQRTAAARFAADAGGRNYWQSLAEAHAEIGELWGLLLFLMMMLLLLLLLCCCCC